ncbi:hypothetical protein EPA93_00480 [Ktedonosporobacter rubrisoli]|uniref:Dienelactone hydrolase domain-containing protein n=1 Tax=Ktedonosporobacter rubrisoli TaxID=2509675 RepID=A0A4P6JHQ2_KTERU|nr:dienelactone hydrolase family protein [Ktedonosporobacter rubrisoli]QBD74547.1 hypothetical protein EPA93_00480 [Ktedonosporobacter rubrisoli]
MCHPVDPAFEYSDATERQLEMPGSGRTIPTFAYRYASEKRLPAVVIGHDVFGASPFYRDIARRLAEQGFATIVPELFCREGTLATHTMEAAVERAKRHNVLTALADLNSITAKLAEDGRKVGILGFCMGEDMPYWLLRVCLL